MKRLLLIVGTRPEGIKLAPLILGARDYGLQAILCATAQHRELLDDVFGTFGIHADYDLDVMRPGQTLSEAASRIIGGLGDVIRHSAPDAVVVQGDTTTTFAGALCGFYAGIPVAHVEAGLRTGNLREPFPEELNRVLTTRVAQFHFAPTAGAANHLRSEGVPEERIYVTGNTGIDAVLHMRKLVLEGRAPGVGSLPTDLESDGRRLMLVTAHRRETFGEPLRDICRALSRLAGRKDVLIVFPVHPNPEIHKAVEELLKGQGNVRLIAPMSYGPFVDLLSRAELVLTDSGGIQEEAPSLGTPVIVMRNRTERPEGIAAGNAILAGTDENAIVQFASELLDDENLRNRMSQARNPYGDGCASGRILQTLVSSL